VDRGFDHRSLKALLGAADRSGARAALIVGDQELAAGKITARPLRGGEQQTLGRDEVAGWLWALRAERT
jgi:histidyl-tRNA synthetase